MHTFKITPEGIKATRRNLLKILIPIILIAGMTGVLIASLSSENTRFGLSFFAIFIPLMILFLIFVSVRAVRRAMNGLESLEISVDENTLTRKQQNLPDMIIARNEIKEIFENPKGDLVIKTQSSQKFIVASRYIERRDVLKELLQHFAPIQPRSTRGVLYLILVFAAVLGVSALFFMAENKWVIIFSGYLLIALILAAIILTLFSKHLERRAKLASLFLLIFVIWIMNRILPVIDSL